MLFLKDRQLLPIWTNRNDYIFKLVSCLYGWRKQLCYQDFSAGTAVLVFSLCSLYKPIMGHQFTIYYFNKWLRHYWTQSKCQINNCYICRRGGGCQHSFISWLDFYYEWEYAAVCWEWDTRQEKVPELWGEYSRVKHTVPHVWRPHLNLVGINLFFIFTYLFVCLIFFSEMRQQGEGWRERKRNNPNQTPHPMWSLIQGLIPRPRNHHLGPKQESDT